MFDTNALFRGCVRKLIRHEMEAGRLAPIWSSKTLDELVGVTLSRDGDLARIASDLAWLHRQKIEVQNEPFAGFRDAGDAHVVRAALAVEASLIVTENLRDFRARHLSPLGLKVLKPDDFFHKRVNQDWPVSPDALRSAAMVRSAKALRTLLEANG